MSSSGIILSEDLVIFLTDGHHRLYKFRSVLVFLIVQWNLDLTKCQETGEICSLYQKPRYNEVAERQPKCLLYRGIVSNCFSNGVTLHYPAFPDLNDNC